jgi:yjeF C-terminal region, hydroxyethylthiazole kinase-related
MPEGAGQVAINSPLVWASKVPSLQVTHKYARGRLWVLGGVWMTGAAALAAGAGLRSGAGLVGIAATGIDSAEMYRHYERALLVAEAEEVSDWRALLHRFRPDALVMGPGLANQPDPMTWIKMGLEEVPQVVLDADGLNAFQNNADDLFAAIGPNMVLTPHEGEFDRLFGDLKGGRVDRALAAAARAGCTVVLKGNDTVIASAEGCCLINSNAPVSLATAGTGDVLAGTIGALMARGMSGFDAASPGSGSMVGRRPRWAMR